VVGQELALANLDPPKEPEKGQETQLTPSQLRNCRRAKARARARALAENADANTPARPNNTRVGIKARLGPMPIRTRPILAPDTKLMEKIRELEVQLRTEKAILFQTQGLVDCLYRELDQAHANLVSIRGE